MVCSKICIAVGVCGALFLGYCIYFDKKRHADPNFKIKLRERRRQQKEKMAAAKKSKRNIPHVKPEDVQHFFLQEVQLGEELLASGDLDNGLEHLANAVAICGKPDQLLAVLHQTLPPNLFEMLLQQPALINLAENRGLYGVDD